MLGACLEVLFRHTHITTTHHMELKAALAAMHSHYVKDCDDLDGFLSDLALYISNHGDEEAMAEEITEDVESLTTTD